MPDAGQRFWDQAIETRPRRELAALQRERLRWQVERCYRDAPFYRERFERAGLRPGHIATLEDVRHLPFVTKQDLRDEQAAHPPFGRYTVAPRAAWRELHPSTGTTGVPVSTIWSAQDVEVITDHTARTMWGFGVRPGDIVQNAFAYGLWVAGLAVHYAAARIGCFTIPIGAGATARQVDYLVSPGATVLLATPSFAIHIAEHLRERGIAPDAIPLRLGCFGGEPGASVPATRARIEGALGIDCFDYYGLGEIAPTFACECTEKAGLHLAEDHYLAEIVDPETRAPVPPGEVGILVLTHLTREATPMLRYWTNDYARLDPEPCRCGRTHARLSGGILGRADDLIIYKGAKFYPIQVEGVVRAFPDLGDEFRIELGTDDRAGTDRVTVVVEAQAADATDLQARLRRALREALGVTPEVRIVPPGALERTVFKARRVVDLRRRDSGPGRDEPGAATDRGGAHGAAHP
jgi:phenylacetate-CoA ligase